MYHNLSYRDRYKVPKLSTPVIIYCKDQYTRYGTYTVLLHPRKYEISFRGLWHPGDFMTTKPYGKLHGSIVCPLSHRTVHLIDGHRISKITRITPI